MFTGIIENTGVIEQIIEDGSNKTFWITSPLSSALKIDQSVSHNGVCLTVEEVNGNNHRVSAIDETLRKTNINDWKSGNLVNLEQCLAFNGRLDGHLVQGHVDSVGLCKSIKNKKGSTEFVIEFNRTYKNLVIEKGSISLNGISLTIFNVGKDQFTVAIIPYTFENTNIRELKKGEPVNLEFDIIGKYVDRILGNKRKNKIS